MIYLLLNIDKNELDLNWNTPIIFVNKLVTEYEVQGTQNVYV